jgi:hypothetical protein
MPREVTDGAGTTWSCVEAYAGLDDGGKGGAARVEGTDRYRVVCTPGGGAQSVSLELPGGWDEGLSDEELLREIEAAAERGRAGTGTGGRGTASRDRTPGRP